MAELYFVGYFVLWLTAVVLLVRLAKKHLRPRWYLRAIGPLWPHDDGGWWQEFEMAWSRD